MTQPAKTLKATRRPGLKFLGGYVAAPIAKALQDIADRDFCGNRTIALEKIIEEKILHRGDSHQPKTSGRSKKNLA